MTEFLKQCAEKDTLTAEDRARLVEVADKLADRRMVYMGIDLANGKDMTVFLTKEQAEQALKEMEMK